MQGGHDPQKFEGTLDQAMEVRDRILEVCDQKVFVDDSFGQRVEVHDRSTVEHD